jgi:glycosyltransferase involved in cell wall biosynthesis
MKFSILINTHNQDEYLNKAIKSCLDQSFRDYEIIICDTSDKNIKNNKFFSKRNISYFHLPSKYKQAEQNQMMKVLFGLKKSKGDFICLMDGDDYFSKKKLYFLDKLINKKKIFFNQDNPVLIKDNFIFGKKIKKKVYKLNYLFKLFINDWPQIYGTSSILVRRKLLETFFKKAKPFKWKFLAIDAQLSIFCKINYDISSNLENLTKKIIHNNNLGTKYLNIFNKKFWVRRYMQHKYYFFIKKNRTLSLDFILTAVVYYFLKIYKI